MQVGVKNLKLVGGQGWTLMREGESEKQVLLFYFVMELKNLFFSVFTLLFHDFAC